MKTLLILGLLLVCVGGSYLSRPSQADFAAYMKTQNTQAPAQQTGTLQSIVKGVVGGLTTDAYLQSVTFHDHFLWTSVESNGQTQYVGAFSHWFKMGDPAATTAAPAAH